MANAPSKIFLTTTDPLVDLKPFKRHYTVYIWVNISTALISHFRPYVPFGDTAWSRPCQYLAINRYGDIEDIQKIMGIETCHTT